MGFFCCFCIQFSTKLELKQMRSSAHQKMSSRCKQMHNNHNNNIGESPEKENYQLQKYMDCNFKLNRSLFTLVALFYLPSFSLAVWLFFFCLASRTSSYTLVLIIKLLWFYINKLVDNAQLKERTITKEAHNIKMLWKRTKQIQSCSRRKKSRMPKRSEKKNHL